MQDLTPKQIAAVAALLAGKSVEQAAQAAEVDPATVHRWFKASDAFNDALSEGRRAALHTAITTLSYVSRSAAAVVLEVMNNKNTPPSVRLRAVLGVLELLTTWAQHQELDERLRRLEKRGDDDNDTRTTPTA
jgi:AcrR family transcriptional regulator